jgi:NADH:ubiquinone oxidoreductase subunit H
MPPGFVPLNTSVGLLFFMAVPAISVIGVLLAGWSSRNTYATLGGLRAAAQMISYELSRTLSILPFVLLAGSMRPLDVMDAVALVVDPAHSDRIRRLSHLIAR